MTMLRDFTWTEKYEEAMWDEHPHLVLFSPFENGVPKYHKKRGKFICEQLAKVSKIYCFINLPFSWYQGSVI